MSADAAAVASAAVADKGVSLWNDAFRRLCKDRLAVLCFCVIVAYAVLAAVTIAGFVPDPDAVHAPGRRAAPSPEHWFGLNTLGQDVGSRIAGGTWIAMSLGFSTRFACQLESSMGLHAPGFFSLQRLSWQQPWKDRSAAPLRPASRQ